MDSRLSGSGDYNLSNSQQLLDVLWKLNVRFHFLVFDGYCGRVDIIPGDIPPGAEFARSGIFVLENLWFTPLGIPVLDSGTVGRYCE